MKLTKRPYQNEDDYWRIRNFLRDVFLLNDHSAPLYRRDLDIVSAASDGEIAAFCTIWFDDVTRSAVCVLVGTAAQHQRRGLGKAVMYEGLRRLKHMGGTRAFANAYDPQADALYGSVLGTKAKSQSWVKVLD